MNWKVIKSEQEYNRALDRIEQIFDALPGQTDYDELELLGLLIKDYEDRYYPMPVPDPIEVIKFKLMELGLKNKDLIPIIGSESHVSSVLKGRRKITLEMAKSLSKFLNIPPDIFINEVYDFDNYSTDKDVEGYVQEQLKIIKERVMRLYALDKTNKPLKESWNRIQQIFETFQTGKG